MARAERPKLVATKAGETAYAPHPPDRRTAPARPGNQESSWQWALEDYPSGTKFLFRSNAVAEIE